MLKFPSSFLWGAATSAYQVEGNNANSDWWPWEKKTGKQNSGQACRHYEMYEHDFDLAKSLNHNAHRLSIEWARIEPREGEFSQSELQHYVHVVMALRKRGIEPMVTLHHFTNPIWFSESGGWESRKSTARFLRYCDVVTRALAPHVHYWMTINEPTIYVSHSFLFGNWPPQAKSYLRTNKVFNHLLTAHIKAYQRMHQIYKELGLTPPAVGIAQHLSAIVPCSPSVKNRLAACLRDQWFNFKTLDRIKSNMDFIGINYYSRQLVDLVRWGVGNFVWDTCKSNHDPVKKNSLNWDIYPQGLQKVLLQLKKYNLPVIITENGICTSDDTQRWEFIQEHLKNVHAAMAQGVNVQGYLYWSLLDNFEWAEGFTPRFGLIDVNYQTFQRTIRESARQFGQICKTGILE